MLAVDVVLYFQGELAADGSTPGHVFIYLFLRSMVVSRL